MFNNKIADCLAILSSFGIVNALPSLPPEIREQLTSDLQTCDVNPPSFIPEAATETQVKYRPVLGYDTDSCYNVFAVDAHGNVVEGRDHNESGGAASGCRDASDLDN